ncbi:MAG: hypothetical protein Fur0044_10510 [Anaerolineae bacterium]
MKRSFKLFSIFSLLVVLSLTLTGLASAETIRGKGWLYAKGNGAATLRMSGQVEIKGHGAGAVYIYGAEEINASGQGKRANLDGGGVVFKGYSGTITVTGEKMVVKMVGTKIEFKASGQGVAHLRGRGYYETAHLRGDWNNRGLEIEIVKN